jgi:hypothetical protein
MAVPAFGQWPEPTPEELHMTAPAEDPGAKAVYLDFDENDNDMRNDHVITVRLKILTQAGVKRYSDIEPAMTGRHFAIEDVQARTIHSDGTVIPFKGHPFVKTIKERGETFKATVFSMPDVQVGSILEYTYRLSYDDGMLLPARWYIQHDAYALHEHYRFTPFDTSGSHYVKIDHDQISQGLSYIGRLPKDAKLEAANGVNHNYYELTVTNVPALPDEEYLPPIDSLSYRELFYYAAQMNDKDYWDKEGKYISKDINTFATAGAQMKTDVQTLTAAGDAPELKAKKLYIAAMKMENTDYTRRRSQAEEQAQGLHPIKTAEDVWKRKRGDSEQIAMTYLAMLRAAGIKAYGMEVTDRDHNLFEREFPDTSQLNGVIVVANLNGKDEFLDPGSQFCPFGMLAWEHSFAQGLRQVDGAGMQIAQAAPIDFKQTTLVRATILTLAPTGEASGTVSLTYTGEEAMLLRQREVGEDAGDTKHRMEEKLRRMLPGGMQLHVIQINNLDDGEKPLSVVYGVSGPVATITGHRLLLQEALLRQDEQEQFASATRKNAVYFQYPYLANDVVVLHLEPGVKLEGLPKPERAVALGSMAYTLDATSTGDTVRMTRSVGMNAVILNVTDYAQLRQFFGDLHAADENQVLFTREASAATATGPAAGGSAN